jgi:hypothetical protein
MGRRARAPTSSLVGGRQIFALTASGLILAALVGSSGTATARPTACGAAGGAYGAGYAYAGHQATDRGHGVRATITARRGLNVAAGHVAGWVGLGGPGQGANGEDAWIQVGIASVPGAAPFVYAEIARGGREPQFTILDEHVEIGSSRDVAVLEISGRPGWWRIWVDGEPRTKPVQLVGSSGLWAPIATAESWNGGRSACNRFAFRFERVSVSYAAGGSWRPFVSGYRFLDSGNSLRALAEAPATSDAYERVPAAAQSPLPYAFLASS